MIEYNRCKTYCRGQPPITSHLAVSYHVCEQFSSVQFSSVQFSSVQFSSVQFSSVQFSSVQFSVSSVQFSSVQFSSVQFRKWGDTVSSPFRSFLRAFPISCVKYIELRANPDIVLAEQVSINFNLHILWLRYNLLNRE